MATLTNVIGTLYDATGVPVSVGTVYITLQQDIISVDGTKVAPTTTQVNLASTAGVIDVDLYATVGASPSGVAYFVEYDPDPSDLTKPRRNKTGYWSNYWAVPNTSSVTLGSFAPALRGSPTVTYLPVLGTAATAGSSQGYITVLVNGVPRKIQYFAVS